jgi:hypothetical protein
MRVAVLFHANEEQGGRSYIVHHLAQFWREDGHEVDFLFGTRRFVPADILLVHVDLSVVPADYLRFAARYGVALNARVADIRKSTISRNLVRRGDGWEGPVIVKSNLNYAGQPELALRRSWLEQRFWAWRRVIERMPRPWEKPIAQWQDYQVFESLSCVPWSLRVSNKVVIERFRPELENGLYHLRIYQFLGDRSTCARLASPKPVVKAENAVRVESIQPHPAILAWRQRLGIDYGKLDYVVSGGDAVLLDVNKTTGASTHMADADLRVMRRHLAEGLYSYFRGARSGPARGDGEVLHRGG